MIGIGAGYFLRLQLRKGMELGNLSGARGGGACRGDAEPVKTAFFRL